MRITIKKIWWCTQIRICLCKTFCYYGFAYFCAIHVYTSHTLACSLPCILGWQETAVEREHTSRIITTMLNASTHLNIALLLSAYTLTYFLKCRLATMLNHAFARLFIICTCMYICVQIIIYLYLFAFVCRLWMLFHYYSCKLLPHMFYRNPLTLRLVYDLFFSKSAKIIWNLLARNTRKL